MRQWIWESAVGKVAWVKSGAGGMGWGYVLAFLQLRERSVKFFGGAATAMGKWYGEIGND